jgi:hypothetical protein
MSTADGSLKLAGATKGAGSDASGARSRGRCSHFHLFPSPRAVCFVWIITDEIYMSPPPPIYISLKGGEHDVGGGGQARTRPPPSPGTAAPSSPSVRPRPGGRLRVPFALSANRFCAAGLCGRARRLTAQTRRFPARAVREYADMIVFEQVRLRAEKRTGLAQVLGQRQASGGSLSQNLGPAHTVWASPVRSAASWQKRSSLTHGRSHGGARNILPQLSAAS